MAWLREQCQEYRFDIAGVFQPGSERARWPVVAHGPEELTARLAEGGHLLPLPKEPAALANVLEVSIVDFILGRAASVDGLEVQRGTERGYPDLEFTGPALGNTFHAVDVKAARRSNSGKKTKSRITLYTGNTYFRRPELHWPGTFRPFQDYASHLDILMIYTFEPDDGARVRDLELIVHEAWRIASKERSSTTREYIGAVNDLDDLREGKGAFATQEEFYKYWRAYKFKISDQVEKQLHALLKQQTAELERLRASQKTED